METFATDLDKLDFLLKAQPLRNSECGMGGDGRAG